MNTFHGRHGGTCSAASRSSSRTRSTRRASAPLGCFFVRRRLEQMHVGVARPASTRSAAGAARIGCDERAGEGDRGGPSPRARAGPRRRRRARRGRWPARGGDALPPRADRRDPRRGHPRPEGAAAWCLNGSRPSLSPRVTSSGVSAISPGGGASPPRAGQRPRRPRLRLRRPGGLRPPGHRAGLRHRARRAGGAGAAAVEARGHPDVHLLGPTPPPSNPKGTPALRIEASASWSAWPRSSRPRRRKVFIVDEAEKMTASHPAGPAQDAGGAAGPDRDHPRPLPDPRAARHRALALPGRALPPPARGGRARAPPRRSRRGACPQPAGAGRGARAGRRGHPRLGDQVGRDRPAAETVRPGVLALAPRSALRAGRRVPRLAVFGEPREGGRRSARSTQVLAALRDCREAWFALQGSVSPPAERGSAAGPTHRKGRLT